MRDIQVSWCQMFIRNWLFSGYLLDVLRLNWFAQTAACSGKVSVHKCVCSEVWLKQSQSKFVILKWPVCLAREFLVKVIKVTECALNFGQSEIWTPPLAAFANNCCVKYRLWGISVTNFVRLKKTFMCSAALNSKNHVHAVLCKLLPAFRTTQLLWKLQSWACFARDSRWRSKHEDVLPQR